MNPRARSTDPETSHNAAASVDDVSMTQTRILILLGRYGPQTDEDIAAHWVWSMALHGWPLKSPSGLRSRRAELVARGLVYDTGRRGVTRSGRSTVVWDVVEVDVEGT